jgi:hypothetical protein
MMKVHGVEAAPFEQETPVMLQPENDQPGVGLATIFMACPMGSWHPDGPEGVIVPSPTTVVVKPAPVVTIVSWTF